MSGMANYDDFERSMQRKLLQQEREYEAQQIQRKHMQQFIDRFRFKAKRAALVQSRIKQMEKIR